jgi:hypothetical protein
VAWPDAQVLAGDEGQRAFGCRQRLAVALEQHQYAVAGRWRSLSASRLSGCSTTPVICPVSSRPHPLQFTFVGFSSLTASPALERLRTVFTSDPLIAAAVLPHDWRM